MVGLGVILRVNTSISQVPELFTRILCLLSYNWNHTPTEGTFHLQNVLNVWLEHFLLTPPATNTVVRSKHHFHVCELLFALILLVGQ